MMNSADGCELYIGNLPSNTTESDIERAFERYGKIVRCNIKSSRNDAKEFVFGFVTYESSSDARAALIDMDGQEINGQPVIVEYAKGSRNRAMGRNNYERSRYAGYNSSKQCYTCKKYGHISRDCPFQNDGFRRRRRSRSYRS